MLLLDVARVEDRLGVQLLEDGSALGGIQHVLRLVHAELVENGRQLFFEDFLHPQFHAVLEDQVECLHRMLLTDTVHTPDALFNPHRIPGQIVVDDDVGELQVQTLTTGIGRNERCEPSLQTAVGLADVPPGPSTR